ncbi:lovastatin nonaketide synthase [Coccidioides immitis RMSCC 3703]|uniref:Lovastatin nonaketide synthase n=1 Tax=Coccidioides immitis RMSCC 3703 TaxID=454286 RepID=A0A0J8TM34_COCIT|nr:lovastatin nonaketide synthase [Coccidioides immitis RMSCC 3703]
MGSIPLPKGEEPIAVIGSACRFPGSLNTPSKFWDFLRKPHDLLTNIPSERFNPDGFYHPNGMHHGTSNVKQSYLLQEDHRFFDAGFFNIKPVEAHSIDPQQRLLLETVYESLEAAGLSIEGLSGSQTGVYVGLMCEDYIDHLQRDINTAPTYLPTGTARSIVSNRISYFFNWHGPSCSSSLVAVHQAVQLLRSGESDLAVAAGANLILTPELYIGEAKLKMLSPGSRSRMWDADADGYARGDGVAAVFLKRLSRALEDGDHIECIIRETGVNQDGRTKGITMPNELAQMDLISQTYAKAGLNPCNREDRCQYFEAHGTGTTAGDAREAEAISKAFFGPEGKAQDNEDLLYVGSVKTVIGHTEGTAGVAGLIKASLAVQHVLLLNHSTITSR